MAHTKHTDKTDQELLDAFYADRDNEWLGVLLNRYSLLLFGLCMKYLKDEDDAKDAVQQVFIKVIQELSKYKVAYFKTWLYMVGKNHCLELVSMPLFSAIKLGVLQPLPTEARKTVFSLNA